MGVKTSRINDNSTIRSSRQKYPINGSVWEEPTGYRWIPLTGASRRQIPSYDVKMWVTAL